MRISLWPACALLYKWLGLAALGHLTGRAAVHIMLGPTPPDSGFVTTRTFALALAAVAAVGLGLTVWTRASSAGTPVRGVDAAGLRWIAQEEGGFRYFRRTRLADGTYAKRWNAYSDGPTKHGHQTGNCTIGHGHLLAYKPCDKLPAAKREPITDEEATRLLQSDVAKAIRLIDRAVRLPQTDCEYAALVDFVFNAGIGDPAHYTPKANWCVEGSTAGA